MKEIRKIAVEIRQGLSEKERVFGDMLLQEGLNYESLREQAIRVGKHTSFFLHQRQDIISIHFREGLDELAKLKDNPIKMTKIFLNSLKEDLRNLAHKLEDDASLHSTKEIWGLCALSPRWGERYGFRTKLFEPDPKIVEKHERSIVGKPNVGNLALDQALHFFIHERSSFIRVFGHR